MRKIIIIFILFLCACSASPSKVSKEKAYKLTKNLTYVKDSRTGLCYAVVSSRIWILGIIPSEQKGLGLTQIPCNECKHLIEK